MTLRTKLLTALSGSTSQAPIDTAAIAKGHRIGAVRAALGQLLDERVVCTCRITKTGQKPVDTWWLAGNNSSAAGYRQTANAKSKARAKARLEAGDE